MLGKEAATMHCESSTLVLKIELFGIDFDTTHVFGIQGVSSQVCRLNTLPGIADNVMEHVAGHPGGHQMVNLNVTLNSDFKVM